MELLRDGEHLCYILDYKFYPGKQEYVSLNTFQAGPASKRPSRKATDTCSFATKKRSEELGIWSGNELIMVDDEEEKSGIIIDKIFPPDSGTERTYYRAIVTRI